jgi:hypothetical protein
MARLVTTVFALFLACALAAGADTQVRTYKAGDTGAFEVAMPLPPDLDLANEWVWARASNDQVHLVYVKPPISEFMRMRAARRYERPPLDPESQRRADAIQKEIQALWQERSKVSQQRYKAQRRLNALKELLKSEMRRDDPDAKIVEHTKRTIAQLETEVKELTAKEKAFWDNESGTRRRIDELEEEKRRIWAQGHKQFREQAAAAPLKVYGRFQGEGKTTLSVLARRGDELLSEPRLLALVELDLPAADGGDADVLQQWAAAQAQVFAGRVFDSRYSSYYQYGLLQSKRKYSLDDHMLPPSLGRPRGREVDLYAMTTGGLAIQESLQLDAMTGRSEIPTERSVALSSLTGPTIKSHPFEEMMEGRTPRFFPTAKLVPYDAYYAHFSSISKQIATSDMLKQWGTSLLRAFTVSARDSDLAQKYQDQLCIGVSALTRLFGDMVIGDMALSGNDPFLREGSDVSVLIRVKNRAAFEKQMKSYRDTALAQNPDAKMSTSTHGGAAILSVTTPDRRIASHAAWLDDTCVYSNSPDALRRIIDTHAGKRKSMADNLDFQYMRTIFPGTPEDEDGFVYMSDAFIRKLVGPRWKVEAQRRLICQNHLRMITNGATLFRSELRTPPSLDALVAEDYLPKSTLTCPDSGEYRLDEQGRALCSVHNCLRYCTPVDSIHFDKVSQVEARDYKRFVQRYSNYWRQFFDPIGIRFRVGDTVEMETCILPLIESSIYNQLRAIVGGEPVPLRAHVVTSKTLLAVTAKLDVSNREYKEMLEQVQRALLPTTPPVTQALGKSLSVGLCDSDVLFTVDDHGLNALGGRMDLEERLAIATILSSLNLPMYAVLELEDEKLAGTIITQLLRMGELQSRAGRRNRWDDFLRLQRYGTGKYKGADVHAVTMTMFVIKFRLHYAIAHKRLLVSTKRWVLEDLLDTLAEGKQGEPIVGNVHVQVQPRAFKELLPVTTAGWQERMRNACHENLVPIRALIENHGATEATVGRVSRRIDGVTPRCPAGGDYRFDPGRDLVYCTVHADRGHPRQPVRPTGREPLVKFLSRLDDFAVAFRFTPEGVRTTVTLKLEPEEQAK